MEFSMFDLKMMKLLRTFVLGESKTWRFDRFDCIFNHVHYGKMFSICNGLARCTRNVLSIFN